MDPVAIQHSKFLSARALRLTTVGILLECENRGLSVETFDTHSLPLNV